MNKPMNLQDAFLNSARKAKVPVTIHVTNGYQIKNAIITGYDSFVVTAEVGNEQMMIYKHAISTVTPKHQNNNKQSGAKGRINESGT